MAYSIQPNCNACGDCLSACPNEAIRSGFAIPRIEAMLCTECLGFAEEPECAKVCPEDAIKPLRAATFQTLWDEYHESARPRAPDS